MANIKSAKKRILVNRTKADRNKSIRSSVKTAIKKVYAAIDSNDTEAAKAALVEATSIIDKAETKGVYHKNNASRKISRLSKAVNKMAQSNRLDQTRKVNPIATVMAIGYFFVHSFSKVPLVKHPEHFPRRHNKKKLPLCEFSFVKVTARSFF